MEELDLITLPEAADYAGVPLRTLQHAAKKKQLKARKFGNTWVTTKQFVDAWKNNADFHRTGPKR